MNLKETILKEHSKANCNRIVRWVGKNPQRFAELFKIFCVDDSLLSQRAAWPLSQAALLHHNLIDGKIGTLLQHAQNPEKHPAIKRNVFRVLEEIELPEEYHGKILSLCFDQIIDPQEKAAVKASSLTLLKRLSLLYPDILQEIKLIISERWNTETAAFRSRAKKMFP